MIQLSPTRHRSTKGGMSHFARFNRCEEDVTLERSPSVRDGQLERSPSVRGGQPERFPSVRGGQPERSPSVRGGQPERFPSMRGGQPERFPSVRGGQPELFPSVRSAYSISEALSDRGSGLMPVDRGRRHRSVTRGQYEPDGRSISDEDEPCNESWQKVRLSAIRIIFDSSARVGRRVVWLMLLAVSVAALAYSVHERLGYLFANPIQMNVKLLVNKTLYFPDVTLCNRNPFNLTAVETLFTDMLNETGGRWEQFGLQQYDRQRPQPEQAQLMLAALVGYRNRTAAKVWRLCQHRLPTLFATDRDGLPECFFGRGIQCSAVGSWREVVTVDGVCWTYHNNNSMKQTGVYNHLYMQLLDPEPRDRQVLGGSGFQLLLHEARDDPRLAVHSRGFSAEPGRATDAEVLLEEVLNIPRPQHACRHDPHYSLSRCEADCFMADLLHRADCALPFVSSAEDWGSAGRQEASPCRTPTEYRRATAQLDQLLQSWTGGHCRCPPGCRYIHYEHIADKIKYERQTARTRVFYNHLFFEQRAEEFSYSTWKMICDIGGSLGWTCSASILTVFEIAEIIHAKYTAKRGRTDVGARH